MCNCTEADKGHELSLPSCRFRVFASKLSLPSCRFRVVAPIPGGISFYYNLREGVGSQKKFKNLKELCYTLLVC